MKECLICEMPKSKGQKGKNRCKLCGMGIAEVKHGIKRNGNAYFFCCGTCKKHYERIEREISKNDHYMLEKNVII